MMTKKLGFAATAVALSATEAHESHLEGMLNGVGLVFNLEVVARPQRTRV